MENTRSYLATGQSLNVGDYLVSENERFYAILQDDGNLCIYQGRPHDTKKCVWASKQQGGGGIFHATMQRDGNFCVYYDKPGIDNACLWDSFTKGGGKLGDGGQFYAIMQSNGSLCVYKGSAPSASSDDSLWTSQISVDVGQITVNNDASGPNFKPPSFPSFPPWERTLAPGDTVSFQAAGKEAIKFFARRWQTLIPAFDDPNPDDSYTAPGSQAPPKFYKLKDGYKGKVILHLQEASAHVPPDVDPDPPGVGVNGTINVGGPGEEP